MSRAARLFDLIQLLRSRKRAVSAATIAQELGVSKRTVHRDIGTLISLGAPVEGAAGVGYILKPGFLLPPLIFTHDELEALALGGRWVTQRADQPLAEAAQNALAKIAAVLPHSLIATIEDPASVAPPGREAIDETVDVRAIRAAIRQQRKLEIVYADGTGQQTTRTIWPIALVYFDASRLVAGWCEMRRGFRHFRSDRIKRATLLTERYPESRQALLRAWRIEDEGSGRRAS